MKKSYLFLLLILTASVVSFLLQSFIITDSVFKDHFQQLSIERVEDLLQLKDRWAWVNYAILPIIYLLKFTLITLWLLSGAILFGYKASFKKIFQIVLAAEFVWLVPSFITIIWFGFIDTDYSLLDVQYFKPLSLLNFFEAVEVESWLIFPLQSLNLF